MLVPVDGIAIAAVALIIFAILINTGRPRK